MIQDLGSHCYHNEYRPVPPRDNDYILFFHGRQALVKISGDTFAFPDFQYAGKYYPQVYTSYTYLFSIDDRNYYLPKESYMGELPGYSMEDIIIFRNLSPQVNCFALITGYQLHNWYSIRKFCGKCGHPLVPDTRERMMYCPQCKNTEYPKISPAVIVGIRNGNKLLLSKYAGGTARRYALIAGFAEIGETLEETVKREVMEEVGLKVENIQYYKSHPWSLSSSLLMGFYCDLDGCDHIILEEDELSEAEWFEREDIPYDDYDVSLTREMMIQFKKGLDGSVCEE